MLLRPAVLCVVPRDLPKLRLVMLTVVVLTVPSRDECPDSSESLRPPALGGTNSVCEESDQPSTYRSGIVRGTRLRARKLSIHFLNGWEVFGLNGSNSSSFSARSSSVSSSTGSSSCTTSIASGSVFSIMQQSGKSACLVPESRCWSHECCEQARGGNVNTVIPVAASEGEALIVRQSRRRASFKESGYCKRAASLSFSVSFLRAFSRGIEW
jgi:hypothetical protein